jgi:hypothetical protein
MYRDLAQISKAKDIYRTQALLAILALKPAGHEASKSLPKTDSHKQDDQVNTGGANMKKESTALPG